MIGEHIDLTQYLTTEKPKKEDIDRLNQIVYQKVLALREELDRRIQEDRKRRNK